MSSGGPGREQSRERFLNTDFVQTFGRLLDPGWPHVGSKLAQRCPQVGDRGLPNRLQQLPPVGQNLTQVAPKLAPTRPHMLQVGPRWPKMAPGAPKEILQLVGHVLLCVGPGAVSNRFF